MARRTGKHYILPFLSHIVRVWAHSEYVLLFTHNREKEVACCAYLILAWAFSNNGKRIYEFMMDDLKYFHFIAIHPLLLSMHWLTFCLLPRITKLNDFLLFIIFGLSYYSFNIIKWPTNRIPKDNRNLRRNARNICLVVCCPITFPKTYGAKMN